MGKFIDLLKIKVENYGVVTLPTGVPVCRAAFIKMLGVGRERLARTKKRFRGEDLRKYRNSVTYSQVIFHIPKYVPPSMYP